MEGLDALLAVSVLCLEAALLVFTRVVSFHSPVRVMITAFQKSKHLAKRVDQDMDGKG